MENRSFEYNYSAKEQAEIKRIREKYIPRQEDKMDQLRRLDSGATAKANIASLVLGITGTLVFGTGMCLCLVWSQFVLGIGAGVAGAAISGLAYPVYVKVVSKEREKIAPLVIQLTDDLLK